MFAAKWVYELVLSLYVLSLIGYFIDFVKSNWRVNKLAFWLLSMVWLIQTALFIDQMFIERNFPVLTLNDGLFFYAWVLLTFSLLVNRLFPVDFIIFFTNIFSFFIILLHITLIAQQQPSTSSYEFVHEILMTHIMLTIVSYAFFTISFLLSMMYLLQYTFIKEKIGLKWLWRFGDLKSLDAYSFIAVMIGFPLLLIGIILGLVWAYVADAQFSWLDVKTIGSFLILIVYAIYFLLRLILKYRGKRISIYNTIAFSLVLINFFLFSMLSKFHVIL